MNLNSSGEIESRDCPLLSSPATRLRQGFAGVLVTGSPKLQRRRQAGDPVRSFVASEGGGQILDEMLGERVHAQEYT